MFYSHEILTSRKYGVATIWLVATLGSKTSLKKVSRKAILDVDVVKACETIAEPEVPMALRLQSGLLYGVTRVFSQQCGYVLADAVTAHNNMLNLVKLLRTSTLETTKVSREKTDNLILEDDPNFLPEINLFFANDDFTSNFNQIPRTISAGIEFATSDAQSQQSKHRSSDRASFGLPSFYDDSSLHGYEANLTGVGDEVASGQRAGQRAQYEGLQDDLGMIFDHDGNLITENMPVRGQSRQPDGFDDAGLEVDLARPLITPGAGGLTAIADNNMSKATVGGAMYAEDPFQWDGDQEQAGQLDAGAGADVEAATATQRQRKNRVIAQDQDTQLQNNLLKRWNDEYLANMRHDSRSKLAALEKSNAKANATMWVLGDSAMNNGPLAAYNGRQLLLSLMHSDDQSSSSQKRARDEVASPEQGRRVRARSEAANDRQAIVDDGNAMDYEFDIEAGREQPTLLDDHNRSTLAPWNMSAGSRRPTLSVLAGRLSSVGGRESAFHQRRRLTSASPSTRRIPQERDQDVDLVFGQDTLESDGFELLGPAAHVDTQTAGDSQWLKSALDDESTNFLAFVKIAIDKRGQRETQSPSVDGRDAGSITFAELLPPAEQSQIVAAQGFLHVLTLCTRAMLTAEQGDGFADIVLRSPVEVS